MTMDESHKTDLPGKAAQASKAPAEAVMQAGSAAPEKPKPWKSQGAEGPAAAKGATGAPSAGKPDSGASHGSGGASHSPSQPASSSPKAASQGPAAQPERPQTTPPSQASAQPKDTSRPAPDFAQPQAGGGDGSASRRFAFFNRTKAGEGDAAVPARKKFKLPRVPVSFNAPVVLGFVAASLIALLLGLVTGGAANTVLFSTYRTAAFDPLAFVRMFTYVLGHADFNHWLANATLLLIVGPMIEEKYGGVKTLLLILITAFSTALINNLLFTTGIMGASGVVFAMVLLSSFASYEKGSVPLTLVLLAVILIGGQIVAAFQPDGISQFAHIFGGLIGCAAGFLMNRKPRPKKEKKGKK